MKTYGRSASENGSRAVATTSSERPSPYAAAVSTQLTPASTAWRMAATESESSWLPHPKLHSPPPMAQAPKPTLVISMPVLPSGRFATTLPSPCSPAWFLLQILLSPPRSNLPGRSTCTLGKLGKLQAEARFGPVAPG